jgi:hypothetical protein
LKTTKDDFTDKVNIDSPFEKDGADRIQLSKVKNANNITYYLYLTATGSTPNVGLPGTWLPGTWLPGTWVPRTTPDADFYKISFARTTYLGSRHSTHNHKCSLVVGRLADRLDNANTISIVYVTFTVYVT